MQVLMLEKKQMKKKREMLMIERKRTIKLGQEESIQAMGMIWMTGATTVRVIDRLKYMAQKIELGIRRSIWKKLKCIVHIMESMDLDLEIWEISSENKLRIMLLRIKTWMLLFAQMFQFILKMRLVTMIRLRILSRV